MSVKPSRSYDDFSKAATTRSPSISDSSSGERRSVLWVLFVYVPLVITVKTYQFITTLAFFPLTVVLREIFGVEFDRVDSLKVPMIRRKQTLAVLLFMSLIPLTVVAYGVTFWLILFPPTAVLMGVYLFGIFYLDSSPRHGSRLTKLRNSNVWKHFVNYFPIELVNAHPEAYSSETNYVFAYHPHGIIGLGAFGAFGTNGADFSAKFPEIKDLRLLTLSQNFKVPFLRELLLFNGIASCSSKACASMLSRNKSIALVVGGAEESLDAAPGTYRLVLGRRRGFVRVAIQNNAHLVPVMGFGETDAFSALGAERGTPLRVFQAWSQKKLGFAIPLFAGRGIFNYTFGFMPFREKIVVVCGEPLDVPKMVAELKESGITAEDDVLTAVHAKYIEALKKVWDEHKNQVGITRKESLKLM